MEDAVSSLPLEQSDALPPIDWDYENWKIDDGIEKGLITDKRWRMNNLYFVKHIKESDPVRFVMTPDHEDVFRSQHVEAISKRLVILKARQLFMTTYGMINLIDACCFQRSRHCVLSNFSEDEADQTVQEKAHYIAEYSPWLKRQNIFTKTNGLDFPRTGSKIVVSVTARGHHIDYAHITEFAKTSDEDPRKAREILKAMGAAGEYGYVIIESTGKGDSGPFAEIVLNAWRMQREGRPLDRLSWVLKFYPWWNKELNRLHLAERAYDRNLELRFNEVEMSMGITLDEAQRNWYARTLESQFNNHIEDMRQEHPATIEEALTTENAGYILRDAMIRMADEGRIGDYRLESDQPVLCFWDFGFADNTSLVFVQVDENSGSFRIIDSLESNGKKMDYYFNEVSNRQFNISAHVLPWDAVGSTSSAAKLTGGEEDTIEAHFHRSGLFNTVVMPRVKHKRAGFEACKSVITKVHVASHCERLIHSLKNVRKQFHAKSGHYENELQRGREENHYYDAFELFCRTVLMRPDLFESDQGGYVFHGMDDMVSARRRMLYGQG